MVCVEITGKKVKIEDKTIHKKLLQMGFENHIAWHIISQISSGMCVVKEKENKIQFRLTNYDCVFIVI